MYVYMNIHEYIYIYIHTYIYIYIYIHTYIYTYLYMYIYIYIYTYIISIGVPPNRHRAQAFHAFGKLRGFSWVSEGHVPRVTHFMSPVLSRGVPNAVIYQ